MLLVANHISWIDIFALMSHTPLRFVAKSDIQHWPLLGYLASKGNVLFIDRSKRQEAKRMTQTLLRHLNAGEKLCYFLRQRAPVVELTFFAPIDIGNTNQDRRVIADQIQQQIQQFLYGK